jgi:hypothetical protein
MARSKQQFERPTRIYSLNTEQEEILRAALAPAGIYWASCGLVSRVAGALVEAELLRVETRHVMTDTPRYAGSDQMCEYDEHTLFTTPAGRTMLGV